MTNQIELTVENHLDRDARLNFWTVGGIGSLSHETDEWVRMILNIKLDPCIPNELQEIYSRAQACMVYGCYHYPLFTMGCEELFRFGESAAKLAARECAMIKKPEKLTFYDLTEQFHEQKLVDDIGKVRWHATRSLRNSSSHKERSMLVGPNDALNTLDVSKQLTETLFKNCRNDT